MSGQLWEVVGGAATGGIIVREGKDLKSAQTADRLSTGALIRELALEGDRVRYELLTGSGPAKGWVSCKLKDKDLIVRTSKTSVEADRKMKQEEEERLRREEQARKDKEADCKKEQEEEDRLDQLLEADRKREQEEQRLRDEAQARNEIEAARNNAQEEEEKLDDRLEEQALKEKREDARKENEELVRKRQERQAEIERDRKEKESIKTKEWGEAQKKASEDAADAPKEPEPQADSENGSKKHVRVNFRYKKQTWHHEFDVEKGSTILHLKKLMTKSDVEEVHWFELHRNGRPLHSQEQIHVDLRLDFEFVGPRTAAEAAEAEVPTAPKESYQPPPRVAPTPVALAAAAKEAPAHQPRNGAAFMEVTVHLDRSRGFKTVAKIKPGSTVFELKEKLAKSDISGQTRADNFTLALSSKTPLKSMDDSDKIMEGVGEIEVIVNQPPPSGKPATLGTSSSAGASKAPAEAGPATEIEVAVKHAVLGIRIKVKVLSNCKLSDVRDAVAKAQGINPASEVRLVKKMGTGTFASLGMSEAIGSRKEFLAMGREFVPMG